MGQPIRPGYAEKAFVVFVLLIALGAFQNLQVTGPIATQNMGMVGMQILWSILYLITWVLYSRSCGNPFRALFVVSPLIVVVAFAFVSAIWSQDPWLTARRSIALALTLVFGVYLGTRFNLREQFRLLAGAFAICIMFSFLFELLGMNPPDPEVPGWYGIFEIKNHLGQNMALSAIVFLIWKQVEPRHKALAIAGFLASVILLALSIAMTAIVVFALLMLLLPYLQWMLRKSRRTVALATSFSVAALVESGLYSFTHLQEVTSFLGKDPALTGRLPLWIVSVSMALERPWLGYGFDAFWLPNQTYTARIWRLMSWMPPQAHNGILELWLNLGILGTGIFLVVFAYYFAKALQYWRRNPGPGSAWPTIFLAFLFLMNLTTAFFLANNNFYFMLYVAIAVAISTKRSSISPADRIVDAGADRV